MLIRFLSLLSLLLCFDMTGLYAQDHLIHKPSPMRGSYSIDHAVFVDDDGSAYIYFGGIWGGQLQRWESGSYDENGSLKDMGVADNPAILPRMEKLTENMLEFAEEVKSIEILDKQGNP